MINGIKQQEIQKIKENKRLNELVKKLVVFGSSTREDCTPYSDIDIYIELPWQDEGYTNAEVYSIISELTTSDTDILFANENEFSPNFMKNIKKGVVLIDNSKGEDAWE